MRFSKITSAPFRDFSFRNDFPKVLIYATAYFFAQRIATLFPDAGNVIMLVWPAAGVGLAAFLLNPRRLWPLLTLSFYLAGIIGNVVITVGSLPATLGTMSASMVQSIGCAWFILYFNRDFHKFSRVREIIALIAGVIIINAGSACIGAYTSVLARGTSFNETWQSWYISDGLGMLLVCPFIVSWVSNFNKSINSLRPKKIIESFAFLVTWSFFSYIIFYQSSNNLFLQFHPYMLVALLAWPAMRFGMRGLTLALLVLFIISAGSTIAHSPSPFKGASKLTNDNLLEDQIFMIFMSFVGYLMSTFYSGLKRAESSLRKSEERYRSIIETAMDGFCLTDRTGIILQVNDAYCRMTGYTREELLKMQITNLEANESNAETAAHMQRVISIGEDRFETCHRKKNGKLIDFEINVKYNTDEDERFAVFLHDVTKRKAVEEALRKSEALYLDLYENAPDMFVSVDSETGKIIQCNNTFAEKTKYSKGEIIGRTIFEMNSPEYLDSVKNSFKQFNITGELKEIELQLKKKDGGNLDVILNSTAVRKNGKILYSRSILRDISELKRGQKEIKTILFTAMDGFFLIDTEGKILETNEAYCSMIGYTREELLKMRVRDIEVVYTEEAIRNQIQQILRLGSTRFETKHRRKDGRIIIIEASVNYLIEDQPKLFCFIRDITERKHAEEELLKLSRAVEQSSVSVVITNCEGKIEFVNKKLCELTGYSKEELIGKNPRIWKSGYHNTEYYKIFWDTLNAGKNCSGEILNKKENGELYWESALISPLINENGDITHFVAVKEDITENKKMITALVEAKEMAEAANKLKDAFIANISHEIRTPLNGVLGMTHLIKEMFQDKIKDEDSELFDGIELSSKRIIRTVDMILNYSRLQVGVFNIKQKKINISKICKDLVTEFNEAAKYKSLEFTFTNSCGDAEISADENSISIAISNLIDNAIKYTHKGFVNVFLHKGDNDNIILDIKDTGIGISEEYLDHIFEPYQQEQMGYGRAYDGIGLGLALVKKLLDLNNATIKVTSKKNKGTTFSINFDNMERKSPEIIYEDKDVNNNINQTGVQKKAVLLVEDDLMNQVTITRFIRDHYKTIVTGSSDEAKEILKRETVDLILMDISIKGSMNGLELTKELKTTKEYSDIPIIAITAHVFETDKQRATEAGCNNYLSKPFTRVKLLEMIKELV